ncbi:hypothetical protein [Comamonas odontotermitis]|uniref:hypothetical protein n=1 Tax=Comamonas odontotermitis TaxID=379895 RepID=UPI0037525190
MTQRDALPLAAQILLALVELQDAPGAEVSLPRLAKHLGASASVLMRELSLMGDVALGANASAGPGWVKVRQADSRWLVRLALSGSALAEGLQQVG